jgi:methionyl-tRNA synthetase
MEEALRHFRFREAQSELINMARMGNKYLAELEPWHLIKTDKEKTASVLHVGLQIAAALSIAGRPFLPKTADKIAFLLNLTFDKKLWDVHFFESLEFLGAGHQLNEASILFKPIEDEEVQKQTDRLEQIKKDNESKTATQPTALNAVKADITYDDFDKIDLRVGKILEAERVPKADKLLKLTVDLGFEKRTILSGIAEYYKPEELVGKLVTVVANLAPRKIRGIESQGMLLMAGNDFGKLYSVGPEQDIEPGSVVK